MQRSIRVAVSLGALLLGAMASGMLLFWLWRDYLLYAIAVSAMLVGAARLLPDSSRWTHSASLGICIGAFVGSCLGAAQAFAR